MVQNVLCANGYISKLCSVLFFSRRRSEGCLHLEPVLSCSCLAQLPLVLSQSTPRYDLNVLDLPSCCSFLGQGPFFQNGDGFCLKYDNLCFSTASGKSRFNLAFSSKIQNGLPKEGFEGGGGNSTQFRHLFLKHSNEFS